MQERTITALILFSIIMGVIFFVPSLFIVLVAIILVVSTWEWCKISKIIFPYNYLVATATIALWALSSVYYNIFIIILVLSVLYYLYTIKYIYQFESINNFRIDTSCLILIGPIILSALASSFIYILNFNGGLSSNEGAMSLIFIIMVIAAADSGAYFTGHFLGKRKLSPKVSPKKTIEGLIGGLLSVIVIVIIFNFMVDSWYLSIYKLLFISIITAIFSVIGDLFISIIKRQNSIKDSSNILPGHGGALDRIDGMLAGFPIFYLLQQYF